MGVGIAPLVLGLAFLATGCRNSSEDGDAPRRILRLTLSGTPGGGARGRSEALARAYHAAYSDLTVKFHEVAGSVGNLEAIQRGEADIGFALADDAYAAFIGQFGDRSFDRLRGIAVLQLYPLHLIVRPRSNIHDIRELRGRRVGMGPPGSNTFMLKAFGSDPGSVIIEYPSGNEAMARLVAGSLDAVFMFGFGGLPVESVSMAMKAGARLLAIEGPAVDRLRQEYPFVHLAAIPLHTYSGQPSPVHTIGIHSLLVCRRDLDEELVYDLTKEFFAALPALATAQPSIRLIDFAQAPATPIPLHDGAGRYYRERELSR